MKQSKGRIRVEDVAAYLGISPQAVRVRMRNGSLPIGEVVKNGSRYSYYIYPKPLYEVTGMKANGYEPPIIHVNVNPASLVHETLSQIVNMAKGGEYIADYNRLPDSAVHVHNGLLGTHCA